MDSIGVNIPKISIIIPVYNVEQFLPKTMESCLKQTYENIEIIAVDDGSKDQSGILLQNYADLDVMKRVIIIHHESNRGLLMARCTGVAAATGNYIMFLDGDDYLETNACEVVAKAISETNVDVLQFGTCLVDTENVAEEHLQTIERFCTPYDGVIDSDEGELVKACFGDRLFGWTVWNKLWSTEVCKKGFSKLHEKHLILAEDILGSFSCFLFAKSYASIDTKLYNYRQGSGITASGKKNPNRIQSFGESFGVISEIQRICIESDCAGRFEKEIRFVQSELSNNMAWYFDTKIEQYDALESFEQLLRYWPTDLLLSALTVASYRDGYLSRDELLSRIYTASCFQVKTKQIKTVGMFYYRFYNGGVERVVSCLTRIFHSAGYRVILFSDEEKNEDDYPFPDGVVRVVLPTLDPTNLDSCIKRIQAWKQSIEKYNVDTVVYHAWVNNSLTFEEMAIRSTGISMIIHTHGDFSAGFRYRDDRQNELFARQKTFYRLANVLVTLSEMDQFWWSALGYNCLSTINPMPFDYETTEPSMLSNENVLWVGRLCSEKQPVEALKIMEVVHKSEPCAVLHMVGKVEEYIRPIIEDYIKEHDMSDYVVLEGFKTDVSPFYKNSSVMLWTSSCEGMPIGMMESKIFGLPLVAYELPNLDMMRHPKGVVIVPQKDYNYAAETVINLLKDEMYRKVLGNEARESGNELASFDILSRWREIFDLSLKEKNDIRMISEEPIEIAVIHHLLDSIGDGRSDTLLRHEEIVKRHEGSINYQWEIQQWHTEWLNSLEARINAKNPSVLNWIMCRLKTLFKRMLQKKTHI